MTQTSIWEHLCLVQLPPIRGLLISSTSGFRGDTLQVSLAFEEWTRPETKVRLLKCRFRWAWTLAILTSCLKQPRLHFQLEGLRCNWLGMISSSQLPCPLASSFMASITPQLPCPPTAWCILGFRLTTTGSFLRDG